jgi:anaerobic selenocysteine-containing dehydrogenase
MIDTFSNEMTKAADIVLPGATWTEKAGTFLSARNHLQGFERAIPPVGDARSEGQIATDLATVGRHTHAVRFDPQAVRQRMGGIFVSDVRYPEKRRPSGDGMHFSKL